MMAMVLLLVSILMMGKVLPMQRHVGELSDEGLVAACAAGDSAALGLLFDRFHVPVYRFLGRMLGGGRGQEDLDDLVQATFLEALRAAPGFRASSSVQTWLMGIAANLARHHVRGEARRRAFTGRATAAADHTPTGHGRPGPRPDEAAEKQQLLARLAEALPALPHDLRTAFVMCDLEERPGVEVARTLGVPQGTLWRRLHEARKRLRAALGGEKGGTP